MLFSSVPTPYPRRQPRSTQSASNSALLRRRRPRPHQIRRRGHRRLCSSLALAHLQLIGPSTTPGGPCSRRPPGQPNCCLQAQLSLGSDPTARTQPRSSMFALTRPRSSPLRPEFSVPTQIYFDQCSTTWRPLQSSMSSPSL
jgi:hypothetical protein